MKIVWIIFVISMGVLIPISDAFSEVRPFIIVFGIIVIIIEQLNRITLDHIQSLGVISAIAASGWLFCQLIIAGGDFAYLLNIIIFITGLLLSNSIKNRLFFEQSLSWLVLVQVLAEIAYFVLPNGFELRAKGFSGEVGIWELFRPIGTLGDPNYFGLIMFVFALTGPRATIALSVLIGLLSLSKGAILSYGLTVYKSRPKTPLRIFLYAVMLGLSMYLIFLLREGFSVSSNAERYHALIAAFNQNSLLNFNQVGDAIIKNQERNMVVHNLYIQVLFTNVFLFVAVVSTIRGVTSPIYLIVFIASLFLDYSAHAIFLFILGLYSTGSKTNA